MALGDKNSGFKLKINDFIFRFPGAGLGRYDGICRVRTFIGTGGMVCVVLTDLADLNTGSSVTNSVENICQALERTGQCLGASSFIEHYDQDRLLGQTFDLVEFKDNGQSNWISISYANVCAKLDCEFSEFDSPSSKNKRIYEEIQRIRHEIDRHVDEPWPESFDVINRREDIDAKKISLFQLRKAVEAGSSETDLQNVIEKDLSVLGEYYAHPADEYLVIPQFPVGDGYVDFAVLSGRSRMDITLIEIKGADYNLITRSSYGDFSAKTNQAVQQVRRRLGYVTRNYHAFRNESHRVRHDLEEHGSRSKGLIGPEGNLGVDPNKDIVLHSVVIGGRSANDVEESRLRHEYERGNSPTIRIESWDSWLNKMVLIRRPTGRCS